MGTVYINNVVKQMKTDLRLIQEQQPLIHNITNYVAMNFVANSLLAIGASPIMARAEEEVEEISSKSNALALNLGVPESTTAHSMILAGEAAMKKRIPNRI
jgi:hydroxyethylthiazole kinase